jgi:hypothetical protein
VGCAEKGFINIEKYKKIENKIRNYQFTKEQLINELGEPKYDLFVDLPKHNFHSNILVYETKRSDLSKLLIILRVREDDGKTISANIDYLNDEKDMFWPGWEMTLEDIILLGREESEKMAKINSLIKSSEKIITDINTSSGEHDYTFLNKTYLSNVKSYKNIKEGCLIIRFNLKSGIPISLHFLVRLFDRNGNYLSHFTTDMIFSLFPSDIVENQINDAKNPFTLIYNINSIVLPEIKYIEFGFIIIT